MWTETRLGWNALILKTHKDTKERHPISYFYNKYTNTSICTLN